MAVMIMDQVTYGYDGAPVLTDISVTFRKGEIVSLLGPNGSGKTTLLKLLLGIYTPQKGGIFHLDSPICKIPPKELARRVAYVPQIHKLSFGFSVLDVVLMGRLPHKPFFFSFSASDRKMAEEALDRLSILHLKDQPYTRVSGGERQLALIARALVQGADTFIMDEPVNGLDYGNQIRLLREIKELGKSGYTFIQTTHFPDHALFVSDRVLMLKDGKILADGNTDQVITKKNLYRLYGTFIDVHHMGNGLSLCVPEAFCNTHRATTPSLFKGNGGISGAFVRLPMAEKETDELSRFFITSKKYTTNEDGFYENKCKRI